MPLPTSTCPERPTMEQPIIATTAPGRVCPRGVRVDQLHHVPAQDVGDWVPGGRGASRQRIPNPGRFRMTFCRDRTGQPTSWHNGRVIAAIRQRRRISTAFPRARLLARGGRSRFDSGQDRLDRRSFGRALKPLNTVRGISIAMSNAFPSQSLIPSTPADGALLNHVRSRELLLPDARLPPFGRRGAGNLSVQPRGERGQIVRAGRLRSAFEVECRQSLSEPALGRSIRHNDL